MPGTPRHQGPEALQEPSIGFSPGSRQERGYT